jgi:hypothetical protein
MDTEYKLRFPVWSKGKCKKCGRNGDCLAGTLMNTGVSRSVGPFNVPVQLGPYCKHCGGRARIELELLSKVDELSGYREP